MVNFGINYIYFMCYYDAKQIDINQICKESTSKDVNVFQVMMTGGREYLALKKDKSFHTTVKPALTVTFVKWSPGHNGHFRALPVRFTIYFNSI
jgi:hypothetical protein